MRIIIDMQGAQAPGSRNRGIGRYTFSFVQGVLRQRDDHEIVLVLNGAYPDAVAALREAFGPSLPFDNIVVWTPPGPLSYFSPDNTWRRRSAELLREAFLASLRPDFIIVTSLFEGLNDDAATSVGKFSSTLPTAVILFDLIPLIQRETYLVNPVVEGWYESKLDSLRRANLLLAISDSSRREAVDYLGVESGSCVNISTAADSHFVPLAVSAADQQALRARYGLSGRYVMYTGGIDHRKNIEGLVRAFSLLPAALRSDLQLAIVCSVQEHNRIELARLAEDAGLPGDALVLTGFVPEDDLVRLYNLCTLFVFPSWHEGFGLPALEAMSCGRAVIAANTSSLPEVIGRDEALFDPRNPHAIAAKMAQVLTDDGFRQSLEQHGLQQARRFSWDLSARRALEAIEHAAGTAAPSAGPAPQRRRPRLAYVAPLPPERSGIADYSAELLPELARHYDIDVISPQAALSDPWIAANCPLRGIEWFRSHAGRFDRVLYHMGNSTYHSHMVDLMETVPGVVVLHDFFISGLASHLELTGAEPGFWTAALYDSHGYAAVARRFSADTAGVIFDYPCNIRVLRAALNVIVHSDNSRKLASSWFGPGAAERWQLIPHMRVPVQNGQRVKARTALGLDETSFVVCSFGLLGPTKLNDRLLAAWLASALAADQRCVLVFVGENAGGDYGAAIEATIAASPARARIKITGWADEALYRQYLAAADVGVQLRTKSRGETSGTVLDCMNYGLATIINAHGSLADLPDDVVFKLPDAFDDAALTAALERMRDDGAERQRLGTAGRDTIRTAHAPRRCADAYALAIEQAYHDSMLSSSGLIAATAQIDPGPSDDRQLAEFAQAVADCLPPRLTAPQLLIEVDPATPMSAHAALRRRLLDPARTGRIEPVLRGKDGNYFYARRFTLQLLGCPDDALHDEVVDFRQGDSFVPLARASKGEGKGADRIGELQARGVNILPVDTEFGGQP
jgi:glycosyltransferase involved in cell wall biosynthesis